MIQKKRRHLKWFESNKESQQKQSTVLQEEHKHQKETVELHIWESWKEGFELNLIRIDRYGNFRNLLFGNMFWII